MSKRGNSGSGPGAHLDKNQTDGILLGGLGRALFRP
jgi:hypothetical protein